MELVQRVFTTEAPLTNGHARSTHSVTESPPQRRVSSLVDMRPTLVIGAGGTGTQIATFLKATLEERFGSSWRQKIKLLAFDTAEEAFTLSSPQGEIRLESGAELFNIGNVPVPNIMRNIEILEAIRERLGAILPSLPPVVLRSGAKQLRPFGLLSLLWNFKIVSEELRRAIWVLAGRDQVNTATQGQGINIFICGSLVGGTGSGTFLDLAHLVRAFFNELGSQAEFCHVTGIGVLPQAFHGVNGPNLYPNTAAALQETNHLMVKANFRTRYPDGRIIASQEAPFNLFYVMDGVDERGQTWSGIADVCTMIAEGIYLQMGSQLGRKGENSFDNLDEALTGQTASGDGTFLSSFGLGYLVFDAPAVADFCTRWFLCHLIQEGWLREGIPVSGLPGEWETHLASDQLLPRLLHDPATGRNMAVELPLPAWLLHKRPEEVSSEASRYVRGYGQARIAESYLPQISHNAEAIQGDQQRVWTTWLQDSLLNPEIGIRSVTAVLQKVQTSLTEWSEATRKKTSELARRLERQTEAATQLETAVSRAASSFPVGRNGRLRAALASYFQAAQEMYDSQLRLQLLMAQQQIWGSLVTLLQNQQESVAVLAQRLATLAARLETELPQQNKQLANHAVSSLSLADETYVAALYRQHQPSWADVKNQVGDPLPLCGLTTDKLENHFLQTLRANFQPICQLSIEEVIRQRTAEMTPRARRQQLFRLATPSWNINRARLPEAGANLVRLEVLGVPDETDTEFKDEPMLVSTRDPHRLTALVVVAGAPQTALQQYDLFKQCLERERGRPFHVLPDFLTGANQARLAFALGSIFDLIYNQGTFFYYRPADALAAPTLLANGLINAIQTFASREGLATEVSERVENMIAQMGLKEAIKLLTDYYSNVPGGTSKFDEQTRELKRLVRDYTEDLHRIDEFNTGLKLKG